MADPDPQYVDLMNQLREAEDSNRPTDTLTEQLHARYRALLRGGETAGGLPYPDPTDPVAEGADAIRSLAEAVDARTPVAFAAGTVITAHTGGAAWVTGVTITLPTGRFTQPPVVTVSLAAAPGGAQKCVARTYQQTATSVTAGVWTGDALGATETHNDDIAWQAVQMTTTAPAARADDGPEFIAFDPETGEPYTVPGKIVSCDNGLCPNDHVMIEVPDDPNGVVMCGACGQWIVPPTHIDGAPDA